MKDTADTRTVALRGGQVFMDDQIAHADILIEDGLIREVGTVPRADRDVDARGLIVAPALVDIHGDAFERQVMPRPGVYFPLETAILETDRQLASNGIATAFHAVTLGWGPGLRAVERGREYIDALNRLAPRLTVDNRVQLRWETFAFEATNLIERVLAGPVTPSLAFNDHTSMMLRDFDIPMQERAFEHSPDFKLADFDDPRLVARFEREAKRTGLGVADYRSLLENVWSQRNSVDTAIRRVAAAARAAGAPMLSHDDTQIETRNYYRSLGARTAEFPMQTHVARAARDAGDMIVFGAPNACRGGSHIGSPGAGDMVEAGLCDALASDYFYPAMLAAIAQLDAEARAPRHELWRLISTGPAHASGLMDRGKIAAGHRADIVLVEWPDGAAPTVRTTLVAGRVAYHADAPAR